ncbi:MAG: M42 family metallopeptidase [Flavobacteriales bacterium]|jgi:putative aminopeptidase FrvX|nr:M42 family metallopeptidase [Flavobacteriales bacterium]
MKNKSIFNKKSFKFLEEYLNEYAPTGFETEGQKRWYNYIKPYVDTAFVDSYGTTVGVINPEAEFKVVIEAHADEIAWYVHYISDKGFIYVQRNGGSDHQIAPSKEVVIHTKKGQIEGFFGWPAIHVRKGKNEKQPSMDTIFIDIGAKNKAEVLEMGVQIGDVITFNDQFKIVNGNKWVGRALDNRIGGFMIAEVARLLHKNKVKLPFGLYIVNAVQEEVGLRGAQMITEKIKPNVAIVTDVTHCTQSPLYNKQQQGDIALGEGAVLTVGPPVHNKLLNLVEEVCEQKKIPTQRKVASRVTGTDTDAFAFSNGGVPSILISLAQRYMHTTVEMVHQEDVEGIIQLIYHSLQSIENDHDFNYWRI